MSRTSGEGGRAAWPEATADREAPRLGLQIGRYAHAKHYKYMRKALRTLRSRVGRVMRDVERQVAQVADSGRAALLDVISRRKRILPQKPKEKNKLYALHAPEVKCLAKARRVRVRRESVDTMTYQKGLVMGRARWRAIRTVVKRWPKHCNSAAILSDVTPEVAVVDRGYKGVAIHSMKIYHPVCGATLHADYARRSGGEV